MDHGQFLTALCNVFWEHQGGFKLLIRPEARAGVVGLPADCFPEGKPVPLDFLMENEQHMHLEVDAAGVRASLMFGGTLTRVEIAWPDVGLVLAPDISYQVALPALECVKLEPVPDVEVEARVEEPEQPQGKVLEFKPRKT